MGFNNKKEGVYINMNPKFDILIVSLFRIMYQSNYDALIELLWEEEKN